MEAAESIPEEGCSCSKLVLQGPAVPSIGGAAAQEAHEYQPRC